MPASPTLPLAGAFLHRLNAAPELQDRCHGIDGRAAQVVELPRGSLEAWSELCGVVGGVAKYDTLVDEEKIMFGRPVLRRCRCGAECAPIHPHTPTHPHTHVLSKNRKTCATVMVPTTNKRRKGQDTMPKTPAEAKSPTMPATPTHTHTHPHTHPPKIHKQATHKHKHTNTVTNVQTPTMHRHKHTHTDTHAHTYKSTRPTPTRAPTHTHTHGYMMEDR
jgi:hypothetical protein